MRDTPAHIPISILVSCMLYFDGAIPRKGFGSALQVCERFANCVKLAPLGIDPSEGKQRVARFEPRNRNPIVFLDFITDAEPPEAIGAAIGVHYPMLYEGSGLPVI